MPLRVEVLAVLVTLPLLAFAEPRSLTVVPHPLEFDPRPELVTSTDKLKAAWVEAVREAGDVVTPSRKELDAALAEVGRKDCRTANDCLAALAVKGSGLYAIHAMLELSEGQIFTVTARVVRDDGKLMASFSAQQPRGEKKKPLVPVVKQVLVDAVKGLGVSKLPAFKEAIAAPPPVVEPPPPPPVVTAPVEVTQPVSAPAQPSLRKPVGFTLLGVGAAGAAAGGVLVLLAQAQARALMVDSRGFLPVGADDATLAKARAANTQQLAGLVALGGGAALALTGLLVALLGPDPVVTFIPLEHGAFAVVGGAFP